MTPKHAHTFFYFSGPLFLTLLSLWTYLPRRFLLSAPVLALENLNKHHAFVLVTKYFYKRLSAVLADIIFARSVKVEAPIQFESEEEGSIEDVVLSEPDVEEEQENEEEEAKTEVGEEASSLKKFKT